MTATTTIKEYRSITLLDERLNQLQELAWKRPANLTLWIGAGYGKFYGKYPTWGELLNLLCDRLSDSADLELTRSLITAGRLQVAAELLSDLHAHDPSGGSLNETVCDIFSSRDWGSFENPLKRITPGVVISTNYDLLLESVYTDYKILDPRHPIDSIFSFHPKLVKLHGSVSDPSSIVLNVSAYARTYTKEFEWFLIHVIQNSTLLFVGAGLSEAEPYMKYIKLLKHSGLLKHDHYALVPFSFKGTKEATDRVIADRSNYLATIGICTLPYVVKKPEDHQFMHELLMSLVPDLSPNRCADMVGYVNNSVKLPGGVERVGPYLFRMADSFPSREREKLPFQNAVAKFLRQMREEKRSDLVNIWPDEIEDLNSQLESFVRSRFNAEVEAHGSSSKIGEVDKNKAFIYDSLRVRRKRSRS